MAKQVLAYDGFEHGSDFTEGWETLTGHSVTRVFDDELNAARVDDTVNRIVRNDAATYIYTDGDIGKTFSKHLAREEDGKIDISFDFLELDLWAENSLSIRVSKEGGGFIEADLGVFSSYIDEADAEGEGSDGLTWTRKNIFTETDAGANGITDQLHRYQILVNAEELDWDWQDPTGPTGLRVELFTDIDNTDQTFEAVPQLGISQFQISQNQKESEFSLAALETNFGFAYLTNLTFSKDLEGMYNDVAGQREAFEAASNNITNILKLGSFSELNLRNDAVVANLTDSVEGWTDKLSVLAGNSEEPGHASFADYAVLGWQALNEQFDPDKADEYTYVQAMGDVIDFAISAGAIYASFGTAAFPIAVHNAMRQVKGSKTWEEKIIDEDESEYNWDGFSTSTDTDNFVFSLGSISEQLYAAVRKSKDEELEIAAWNFRLATGEVTAELEQFAKHYAVIDWLQANVGDRSKPKDNQFTGDESMTLGEEVEFWETFGFDVEISFHNKVVEDGKIFSRNPGMIYEQTVNVSGGDLDKYGVDSFSYHIFDDVYRDSDPRYGTYEEDGRIMDLYVESRYDLNIDLL